MKKSITMVTISTLLISILTTFSAMAAPTIGSTLPNIELSGKSGGNVAGGAWKSSELKGKVFIIYYVDPDEKDINKEMEEAVNQAKFTAGKYQSIAIINMAATWLPNFAIASSLEAKQKKYPTVVYVKDLTKTLVKEWGVDDDNYVVLVLSKEGKVLFHQSGKFDSNKTAKLIKTVWENL